MADWFVYQRDIYPNDMDPDTLGMMIVPDYDTQGQVVYRDPEGTNMNGLRRVCTKWGIDPHFIQYDLVVHSVINNSPIDLPYMKDNLEWHYMLCRPQVVILHIVVFGRLTLLPPMLY